METPTSCINCFHCGKRVSTYHQGIVFRGVAICPECVESEKDAEEAARSATLAENKRMITALELAAYMIWHCPTHSAEDVQRAIRAVPTFSTGSKYRRAL